MSEGEMGEAIVGQLVAVENHLGAVTVLDGDGPEVRREARPVNAAVRLRLEWQGGAFQPAPRFGAHLICPPTIAR